MAIRYPGQQKIGYGEAQVFDTSKLAEGVKTAGELITKRKEKRKKEKAEYLKNLKDIDISKIRNADINETNKRVNAVSDYFYKNSAAIMNPKLDGGKASIMVERLRNDAISYATRSRGEKEHEDNLRTKISSQPDHYDTEENNRLLNLRNKVCMDCPSRGEYGTDSYIPGWEDGETPESLKITPTQMSDKEKEDFLTKSTSEQQEILRNNILDDYTNYDPKEKQKYLLNSGYDISYTNKQGQKVDGLDAIDGDMRKGGSSYEAEQKFLEDLKSKDFKEGFVSAGLIPVQDYSTYQDYIDAGGALDEINFNEQSSAISEYIKVWDDSQNTYKTEVIESEIIQGVGNMTLVANPQLGEHIIKVASKIVPKNVVIYKDGYYKVGEGGVTLFKTKKEADRQSVIDSMNMSIEGHRFKNEMWKELNAELVQHQKTNPEFNMDDLLVKKALPYVQYDETHNLVRDIFKQKGFSIKTTPEYQSILQDTPTGMSFDTIYRVQQQGTDVIESGALAFSTLGTGINTQVSKSSTGGESFYEVTTDSKVGYSHTGKAATISTNHQYSSTTFDEFTPQMIVPYNTAKVAMDITVPGSEKGTTITYKIKAGERIPNGATTKRNGVKYNLDPVWNATNKVWDYTTIGSGKNAVQLSKSEFWIQGTSPVVAGGVKTGKIHDIVMRFDSNHQSAYIAWLKKRTDKDEGKTLNHLYRVIGNKSRI